MISALPAPPPKRKVLILWARCGTIARALKGELTSHFQERCDFEMISDDAAGHSAETLSQKHIDDAALILMLAAQEDWDDGGYPKWEHDYIQAQINDGKRKQGSYTFVKYLDRPPPTYPTAGKIRLHFKSGDKLNEAEVSEFHTWLNSDLQNLPPLNGSVLARRDGNCLLLNWLFWFDDTFWKVGADTPATDPLGCKNDVLRKLRTLKALHSVHAQPGPLLAQMIRVLGEEQHSLQTKQSKPKGPKSPDLATLRHKLANPLKVGIDRTRHINAVETLAQEGLIPVLERLAHRLGEIASLAPDARGFIDDLLSRLAWIANSTSREGTLRRLPPRWFLGMSQCRAAIEETSSGVFLNAADMHRWKRDQHGDHARIMEDTKELHVRILYLATAVVVLFNLLRIQEEQSSESEDDAILFREVLSFHKGCEDRLGVPGLIDPVVKLSNDLIVHYVEAAEKVNP